MSEAIRKILASTSQAFTTAEQKQARDNIGAQASLAFSYSGQTITAIDGSAVGSPGALTGIYHDNNLSGSGISGLPLGLSSAMMIDIGNATPGEGTGSAFIGQHTYLYPNHLGDSNYDLAPVFGIKENNSAASIHNSTAFIIAHTANGVGMGVATSIYGGNGWDVQFSNEDNYIHEVKLTTSGNHYEYKGDTTNQSIYGFGSALFTDSTGTTWEKVDASSIRKWNSMKPETRWESSFQAVSETYPLLHIPKNSTAMINVQGRFDLCSYVNITTADDKWLSTAGVQEGGGLRTWPLTNITTVAKGGSAEGGFTPMLQVITPGNSAVGFTANMVIKEA